MSRRELLRGGVVATSSAMAGFGGGCADEAAAPEREAAVYPAPLEPGDHVRIVAPARPGDARLQRGIEILESF